MTRAMINDLFRKAMIAGPRRKVIISDSVLYLTNKEQIIKAIKTLNEFKNYDHDSGDVFVGGQKYSFKIDYYEDEMFMVKKDPNLGHVCRSITIMKAREN